MAQIKTGKITQVIGAILDVRYKEGSCPRFMTHWRSCVPTGHDW